VSDVVQSTIVDASPTGVPSAMTERPLRVAGITGLGYYVPRRVLTNAELERIVDTNDEWIRTRTGISKRHLAADDESTADLAEKAARQALRDAGVSPQDIQLIIVATCTPDYQGFPSTASLLQDRLQCSCAAFDLGAACSGFVYALVTAQQFIATGAAQNVLVVGAEVLSRIVDWSDRNTCVLFGDGAGAAVLQAVQPGYGMLGFDLGSDGSGGELLKVERGDGAGLDTGAEHIGLLTACRNRIIQNGREVYRFAVNVMGESALRALHTCGIASEDVDLFVPHQANVRIIDAAAKRLRLPSEKVFVNVDKYGNTSAASVPIALCEAREQGRIRSGDTVVMVGFGGGLTWASCVMKWV